MQEELAALRNEITKKNRDQLDMMYNLELENFSEETQALFKKWSDGSTTALAQIEARVNANESSITSLAQWKSEATNSIATIQQTANANESSIASITAWKTNTADGAIESISSIQQQADKNGARIGLLVNSSGTGLNSSAASIIVDAVNGSGSSVMIDADKIQMTGETTFLTANDVGDNGSTVVSGNRISLMSNYGSDDPVSRLVFTMATGAGIEKPLGYIKCGDIGSGEENDARMRLTVRTNSMTFDGVEYPTAFYLDAAGGVSIVSKGDPSGIYLESVNSYITLEATENTRIRAGASYLNMGNTGTMTASSTDYVFCTDGIWYNGIKIVDNTNNVG